MKNYFMIIEGGIVLLYHGRVYQFNLNDGDAEDYWDSFTYNGKELDINYFPVLDSLTIYNVHDETGQIDTSQFETAEFVGNVAYKYVVIDVSQMSHSDEYIRRYKDSGDIILYDTYLSGRINVNHTEAVVHASGLSENQLVKVLMQKINEHERNNLRRGA
jgi:hypothetical protein